MTLSLELTFAWSLHFGEYVADYFAGLVLGHERELRPRQTVIHVVLHLVVLGQTQEVTVLHVHQIVGL